MRIFSPELKNVEKSILDIKKEIGKKDVPVHKLLIMDQTDESKLDILETKRKFILDRRESWLPKTIWNFVVPIAVSVIVSSLAIHFNLK